MTARLTALVLVLSLLVGGLVLQSLDDGPAPAGRPAVAAGVAIPASRPDPVLSSTWYCAAGSTGGGVGEHVVLVANPTDRARRVTVTALPGTIAPSPTPPGEDDADTTTTTAAAAPAGPVTAASLPVRTLELPARARISVPLAELVPEAPLVSAIVEVDGGEVAVEHEITGSLGRATSPCATTAASAWSVPWGVTERGARNLYVFMNPFPDDATVDVSFATDEGVRDALRFQGFVVPGRSVVGAYVDEDVTRKAQVSAQITVRGGRVVVDRVQTFDGTDSREGLTMALGVPSPADVWVFPDGLTGAGLTEQVVVFNPSDEVAEVDVEVRLDDLSLEIPEPFEVTVAPGRFAVVTLSGEERIPAGVAHSILVHSLNGVGVAAERVIVAAEGATRRGVGVVSGSPIAAPTWLFAGGGTSAERDEYLTFTSLSDELVTFDVVSPTNGQELAIAGLQGLEIQPGGRFVIRLGAHVGREDLPILVRADGPIVVERGLYRVGGNGISQAMGIPLAVDVVVPDPINS